VRENKNMEEQNKSYQNIKVSGVKHSMIEIEGEITAEALGVHRKKALAKIKKDFEMPGFRKGNVPEHILEKNIDNKHLLEDAAYAALEEAYPQIVVEKNINVFTIPTISITKLAFGNPVSFKISVGIVPEFKLPNYKKIAEGIMKKEEEVAVHDDEIEGVIRQVQVMRAPLKPKEKEIDGDEVTHPELTDEFVKTLGDFKNVDDFKKKVKENILEEKKFEVRKQKREALAKKLVEEISIEIPALLIEDEVSRVKKRLEEEIKKYNLTQEEYFKKINKTEEQLIREQREYITNQHKTKLILKKIAEEEKIVPTKEELEHEFNHLIEHYKDVDPYRAYGYIEGMLTNEKTLRFLEGEEKEVKEKEKDVVTGKEKHLHTH